MKILGLIVTELGDMQECSALVTEDLSVDLRIVNNRTALVLGWALERQEFHGRETSFGSSLCCNQTPSTVPVSTANPRLTRVVGGEIMDVGES